MYNILSMISQKFFTFIIDIIYLIALIIKQSTQLYKPKNILLALIANETKI